MELVALDGVGPDTAAALLIATGDNPERLKSEASFAHLCGTAPVPASSGKVVRHRLNPGGNRDANWVLHVVALTRLRRDERTQAYVARRAAEGKTKKEAIRCLKRFIARETYRAILRDAVARVPPGRRTSERRGFGWTIGKTGASAYFVRQSGLWEDSYSNFRERQLSAIHDPA